MHHRLRPHSPPSLAPLLTLAALVLPAAPAAAQIGTPPPTPVAVRTLVSPALVAGNRYHCTVMNLSSTAVPLARLDLYAAGQVLAFAGCAGGPSTLAPGLSCAVTWQPADGSTTGPAVHCRAQHTGAEAAIVGSLQASTKAPLDARAMGSVPMQVVTGVSLAP